MRNFYTDLEKAVMDTVCLNYNTDIGEVLDAICEQFGDSGMIEDIVRMAEDMFEEINNDLSEWFEEKNYLN